MGPARYGHEQQGAVGCGRPWAARLRQQLRPLQRPSAALPVAGMSALPSAAPPRSSFPWPRVALSSYGCKALSQSQALSPHAQRCTACCLVSGCCLKRASCGQAPQTAGSARRSAQRRAPRRAPHPRARAGSSCGRTRACASWRAWRPGWPPTMAACRCRARSSWPACSRSRRCRPRRPRTRCTLVHCQPSPPLRPCAWAVQSMQFLALHGDSRSSCVLQARWCKCGRLCLSWATRKTVCSGRTSSGPCVHAAMYTLCAAGHRRRACWPRHYFTLRRSCCARRHHA